MDKWDSKKLPNEFAQNFDTSNHVSTTKDKIMSNGTIVNNNNVFNYLGIEQRGSFRISASGDGKGRKRNKFVQRGTPLTLRLWRSLGVNCKS